MDRAAQASHMVDYICCYLLWQLTMSLNIKNDETCLLARDLARLTGETITAAVTVAPICWVPALLPQSTATCSTMSGGYPSDYRYLNGAGDSVQRDGGEALC